MAKSNLREEPLVERKKWSYFIFLIQVTLIFIFFPHFLFPSLVGGGYYYEMKYISLLLIFLLLALFLYLKKRIYFPLSFFWFFLFLVFFLSLLSWKSPFLTIEGILLFASYAAAFFLGANLFNYREKLEKTLLFSAFLLSLYGLWQFVVGFQFISNFVKKEGILAPALQSRVFSIFPSPNSFAGFLILLIPLGFYYSFKPRFNIFLLFTTVSLATFFLTLSRAGILSLLFSLLILLMLLKNLKEWGKIGGIIILSLFLAVAIYYISLNFSFSISPQTSLKSTVGERAVAESAQGRFEFWRGALNIFSTYPILGSGLGTFSLVYRKFQSGKWYSLFAHNVYLQMASETGCLGLTLFLALLFGIIFLVRKDEKKPFWVSALLGFLFHNFFDYELNLSLIGIAFFLLAGLNLKEGKKSFFVKKHYLVLPFLASFLSVIFFLSVFWQETGFNLLKKDPNRGVKYLERANFLNPLSARGHVWLAYAYFNRGNLDQSLEEAKKAVFYSSVNSSSWEILALNYEAKGDLEKAEAYYKKACNLSPKNPYFYRALGEFYLRQTKYKKAEEALNKGSDLWPLYRDEISNPLEKTPAYEVLLIYVDKGILYLKKKDFKKAYFYASKALSFKDSLTPALILKGKALKGLGRKNDALRTFREVLKVSKSAEVHYELGTIYEEEGEIREAEKEYKKALNLDPSFKEAKERLDSLGVKK